MGIARLFPFLYSLDVASVLPLVGVETATIEMNVRGLGLRSFLRVRNDGGSGQGAGALLRGSRDGARVRGTGGAQDRGHGARESPTRTCRHRRWLDCTFHIEADVVARCLRIVCGCARIAVERILWGAREGPQPGSPLHPHRSAKRTDEPASGT